MLEKAKSQEKKVKKDNEEDSQKNVQKSKNDDSSVAKTDEPINMEIDTIKNSNVELAVNPVNEKIKDIVDNSLKTE